MGEGLLTVNQNITPVRRYYCDGSAHRLGIECRYCAPTRLERHEASCHGLKSYWHLISFEHVRLAEWDWREAKFGEERSWERYRALRARLDALPYGQVLPADQDNATPSANADGVQHANGDHYNGNPGDCPLCPDQHLSQQEETK
jgi:hypothetical protein